MNTKMDVHTQVSDLLAVYVSGTLDPEQRAAVEKHLVGCASCQDDLLLWRSMAAEVSASSQKIAAPRDLPEKALAQIRQNERQPSGIPFRLRQMVSLLRSQMPLVHREIWPASALVIALGYIAALIAEQSIFIYALAPLITATCVSLIYGSENDAALELTLSTPTSPRQILLARLVLVFGYNLALVFAAIIGLMPLLHQPLFGSLVLSWLAPMTFLSAVALVLSLWIGTPSAISVTYVAWLAKLLAGPLRSPQAAIPFSTPVTDFLSAYQNFWQATGLLLGLAALLFAAAIWLVGRQESVPLTSA